MTLVELKKKLRNRSTTCKEKYTFIKEYYVTSTFVLLFGASKKGLVDVIPRYFYKKRERVTSKLICAAFEREKINDNNIDIVDLYNDIKHDICISYCWLVNYKNKLTIKQVAEFIAEHSGDDEHNKLSKRLLDTWKLKLEDVIEVMTEEQRMRMLLSGYKIIL
jgi:glutamate synthase domain-containing protein 3